MKDLTIGDYTISAEMLKTVLICVVVGVLALILVRWVKRQLRRFKSRLRDEFFGGITSSDLREAIATSKATINNPPERSVFGMTEVYLPQIQKSFPDYHLPEAKAAVAGFVTEYLNVRYEGNRSFPLSNVEKDVLAGIELPEKWQDVTDVVVHKVAISDYLRSAEYATITYQASVGYNLDGKPHEDRYAVKSTLKSKEDGLATNLLVCERCGGTITSTADKNCPYCGAGIVWDTRLAWRFTEIHES